jgi:NAD(P)-dependent dehydrogenase (short-subunit alcohol dehydrogenase family)
LLRTIEREWRGVRCRVVDFDAGQPARRIARWLADELVAPPDGFEVGYPGGERTVYTAVPAPLEAGDHGSGLAIADDWIVLATGGARGITAEIVRSWAKPGMTFILVGRSPLEDASDPAPADPAAARARLIARDQAAGLRRRPAEVEREVVETLHRQEAARTLAALRELGAKVEYHAVDARAARRFGALIADVYARHGRIDAVLHGAGIIEDKHLVDKTDGSIDRVFDTKVDSAFNLYRSLRPETLKSVVFFASVAGRNGNPGQADYAAANEVLNRLALRMAVEWPTVRVLSINWGPWTGVGMAVDALRVLGQRFAPIEPEAGCRFLKDELERGSSADVEVIAGETSPATVTSAADAEAAIGDTGSDALVDAASGT